LLSSPGISRFDIICAMKAWLQKVGEASVTVDDWCTSSIGKGLSVLSGVS
jgi:hypothetical protein